MIEYVCVCAIDRLTLRFFSKKKKKKKNVSDTNTRAEELVSNVELERAIVADVRWHDDACAVRERVVAHLADDEERRRRAELSRRRASLRDVELPGSVRGHVRPCVLRRRIEALRLRRWLSRAAAVRRRVGQPRRLPRPVQRRRTLRARRVHLRRQVQRRRLLKVRWHTADERRHIRERRRRRRLLAALHLRHLPLRLPQKTTKERRSSCRRS
jgi:hypothetical protein